ncbi:hypothetical protein PoB_001121800 [Plakobranchus ocellatus]|uniref:Uncharacterized protein n=1 Tax=Plakobranchus ocellatus TaxID=259542 RepID=A0AAV3YR12_9GAST|nr:hypothetical protein PoB_001121800 [Plakobranchus ocellatus]
MSSNCIFPAKEDSPVLLLQHLTFSTQWKAGITHDPRMDIRGLEPVRLELPLGRIGIQGPVEKCSRKKRCGTDPPPFGCYKASKSVSIDSRSVATAYTDSEAACEAAAMPSEESCLWEKKILPIKEKNRYLAT